MKDSVLLSKYTKNTFSNISDAIFNKFVAFSRDNPAIVSLLQVYQKLMIFDFVLPMLKKQPIGKEILEIGSGSGLHSALLSSLGSVTTTDLKKTTYIFGDAVDENRKHILDTLASGSIKFTYNDGLTLPFEDESFDVVFHNSVIEHVPDLGNFNKEVHRVLKPGGICICITGTPNLCRFRYTKFYLFRIPLTFGYSLMKISNRTIFYRLKFVKKLYAKLRSRIWHFYPTDERIKEIVERDYPGEDRAASLSYETIRSMYPRILHFVREPEYNRILLNALSSSHGISPRSFLLQLVDHFKSPKNEFIFSMTPQTHSQHTQNYKTETDEWKVENWEKSFVDAGFRINGLCGCRYSHIFDITYSYNFNAWLTHMAQPVVRLLSRKFSASLSTEFVMLAQKP